MSKKKVLTTIRKIVEELKQGQITAAEFLKQANQCKTSAESMGTVVYNYVATQMGGAIDRYGYDKFFKEVEGV